MTEREEFEAWAKSQHFGTEKTYKGSGNYLSGWTHFCWLAWQAARKQAVPSGYSLQYLKTAYIDGYYEGAGDDAWHADHNSGDSLLSPDASVLKPLSDYVTELPAAAPQAKQVVEPAAWECRTYHGDNTSTPGWDQWERITASARYAGETVEARVREIRDYIDRGYKYELRALYTAPPTPDVSVLVEAIQKAAESVSAPEDCTPSRQEYFKWGARSVLQAVNAELAAHKGAGS